MRSEKTQTLNRIDSTLQKEGKLLSIYFTAGYPHLQDTLPVLLQLQESGVDMVEIGLPFSDPLADGPTIQQSSTQALKNGMSTAKLFEQLKHVRDSIHIPLILMGYFNPVLQYGVEAFCIKCREVGIDGLILPDLPLDIYQREYQPIMQRYGLKMIFLITPQTSAERIRQIDAASDSFIYMVSSASTTGVQDQFGTDKEGYFKRIASMQLKNPQIVGFGIHDRESYEAAVRHTKGAIIGSAFIKSLTVSGIEGIAGFIKRIR